MTVRRGSERRLDEGSADLLLDVHIGPTRDQEREELLSDLIRVAAAQPERTRGVRGVFLEKYAFLTRPSIVGRLGRFMAELVSPDVDRLAAPALGAVAVGTAVALETGLPLAIVRHEERLLGKTEISPRERIKGEFYSSEDVALIEDVVATGSRAMEAIDVVRAAGGHITEVVAVADRDEGAAERFAAAGLAYRPLFAASAFEGFLIARGPGM